MSDTTTRAHATNRTGRHPRANLVSSPANAHAAAARARRYRAEWLVAVAQDLVTPLEMVAHAATAEGRALRKVRLVELLGTQPDAGSTTVRKTIGGVLHQLSVHGHRQPPVNRLTIGWVLDPRSNGRRFDALVHALEPRTAPWPGFPFEPRPVAAAGGEWA